MKRILLLLSVAIVFMWTPVLHSQTMTGGISDSATVRLQPNSWIASKIKWVDQAGNIVMFENGTFVRYVRGGIEQLALVAMNERAFVSVHWVGPDPMGNYIYDRVTLSLQP